MSDELSPDDELEALLDEFEWSPGDEHDLPRRDHFLAAMRPAHGPYSPPVEALSTLGSPDTPGNDTPSVPQEFAAELVRMARDRDLFLADEESPTVYAGVHAVRALKQLELGELVPELIPLFDVDSEWFLDNDLPELMASAGPIAVPPLAAYWPTAGAGAMASTRLPSPSSRSPSSTPSSAPPPWPPSPQCSTSSTTMARRASLPPWICSPS